MVPAYPSRVERSLRPVIRSEVGHVSLFANHKAVIVGAGAVGSQCAASLMMLDLVDEIVLIDVDPGCARAQAMDLDDMGSGLKQRVAVRVGTYDDCADAQFVIISAGRSRRPGQSRRDMLAATMNIMGPIAQNIKASGFDGILITVTNPADVVAEYLYRQLGLPRTRVFGTGTSLDTARLRRLVSERTGISRQHIQAFALGEHGESSFVWGSHMTIESIPLTEFYRMHPEVERLRMVEMNRLVRQRGSDIVAGKGKTEYGISTVVTDIVNAIIHDERSITPLSVHLEGEYGESGLSISVPCVIGACGIEEVLEVDLTQRELGWLHESCEAIRGYAGSVLG